VTGLCLRPGTFSFVSDNLHGLGLAAFCGAVISLSDGDENRVENIQLRDPGCGILA
jgi:hypothetical protein